VLVVTRPQPQAGQWVAALQARGQPAVALPLLRIEDDPRFAPAVAAAWQALPQTTLAMFVSPNAVARFFAAAGAAGWPAGVAAGATGPGTVAALLEAGVAEADIVAPAADARHFDADTLWQQRLAVRAWAGRRVLIVRGESGRDWLADTLRQAGAAVEIVSAYRSAPAPFEGAALQTLAAIADDPAGHAWLFSSSKAIEHLAQHLLPQHRRCALATHPRIAATARAAGFSTVIETRPDLAAVMAAAG
jgi:uroporphyrinogen-III synthase